MRGLIGGVGVVDPHHLLGRLNRWDIEIDDDRFLAAAHQNAFERFIGAGVDLLMRNIWRDVDEVAGSSLSGKLQLVTPPHASAALHDIDDALELAVMVSACLRIRVDCNRACPEFAGAGSRVGYRRSAIHSGSLRSIGVEFASVNDANSIELPFGFRINHILSKNAASSEVSVVNQVSPVNSHVSKQ